MHLHRRPLLLVELARLVEDGVAHPELAHIVEQGAPLEPAPPRLGQPHLGGEDVGIERHPAAVSCGIGALGVHHLTKGRRYLVQIILIQRHLPLPRRVGEDPLRQPGVHQPLPEGVVGQRLERPDQGGIKPVSAALAQLPERRVRACGGVKHVHHLAEQGDTGEERDPLTRQLQRPPFAVPVLIQGEDALSHLVAEAQLASDVRPPVAASLDQLVGYLIPVAKDVEQAAKTPQQIRLQAGVAQHEVDHFGEGAIHQLKVALEVKIVGEIELADAGGIAAAPQILEQQRVVEVVALPGIQSQLLSQTRAYPAAADAVASWLPFRHVQGMAERTNQLCQAQSIYPHSPLPQHRGVLARRHVYPLW